MPSEKSSFTPSSILFRPRPKPRVVLKKHGLGWRRRVPPPGPIGLLRSSFIAIAAASAGKMNIRAPTTFRKGCRRAPTQKLQGIELQSYRLRAASRSRLLLRTDGRRLNAGGADGGAGDAPVSLLLADRAAVGPFETVRLVVGEGGYRLWRDRRRRNVRADWRDGGAKRQHEHCGAKFHDCQTFSCF